MAQHRDKRQRPVPKEPDRERLSIALTLERRKPSQKSKDKNILPLMLILIAFCIGASLVIVLSGIHLSPSQSELLQLLVKLVIKLSEL
jgi:hypothetical protein